MTGKAGEYAVASQLYLRMVPVMFPPLDLGADLIALSGCRIQVKSAHLCATEKMIDNCGRGQYFFPLLRSKRRAVTNSVAVMVDRSPFSQVCDVVVFWGIEENRFWVVPACLADKSTGLALGGPDPTNRFVGDLADMRRMLADGESLRAVGRKHGLHPTSIKQLLANHPDRDYQEPSITSQVRQCENAWDNILDFRASAASSGEVVQFTSNNVESINAKEA